MASNPDLAKALAAQEVPLMMKRCVFLILGAALVGPVTLRSGLALAQAQPLQDNANRWNGRAHPPTQPEVIQREKSVGVAKSPDQRQAANSKVEGLYQKLIHDPQLRLH